MKHYKSECDKLIQYNPDTKVYKLRNTIKTDNKVISEEDFKLLNVNKIKRAEFSRLMNIYFKNVKHDWIYEGVKYRKIDNFEENGFSLSDNYKIGTEVPFHEIGKHYYEKNLVLVYHWGRVYYHTVQYNGDGVGQLVCPYTHSYVRWAKLKHCSPIFNTVTKKII